MGEDNVASNGITWKWLVGILVFLVMVAVFGVINDTRSHMCYNDGRIEALQEKKVNIDQYRLDIREINDKLDYLIGIKKGGNRR